MRENLTYGLTRVQGKQPTSGNCALVLLYKMNLTRDGTAVSWFFMINKM